MAEAFTDEDREHQQDLLPVERRTVALDESEQSAAVTDRAGAATR